MAIRFANVSRPVLFGGLLLLAMYVGKQVAQGPDFRLLLAGLGALGVMALVNPRLGVYAFCFTILLVPFDWRVPGLKLASPNAMVVAAAALGVGASLAKGRIPFLRGRVLTALLVAFVVTGFNLVRYGASFVNVPLILGEAVLLFVLGAHLIRSGVTLREFLGVFMLAIVIRNVADILVTIASIIQGNVLGAIQTEQLWLDVTATSESDWRVLMLPVFLALSVMPPRGMLRTLGMIALLLDVAWLVLAGTRTGMVGLALTAVCMLVLLPKGHRSRFVSLAILLGGLTVIVLGTELSQIWENTLWKTSADIAGGFEQGRLGLWRDALTAFLRSPLTGEGRGASHSYFLGAGRTMGLAFLIPLGLALWMVWRQCAWLRAQPLDSTSKSLVIGLQGALLVSIPLNIIGTAFQGAVAAMFFWLLVGVQEAIYQDVRSGRYHIVKAPGEPAYASRLPGGDIVHPVRAVAHRTP